MMSLWRLSASSRHERVLVRCSTWVDCRTNRQPDQFSGPSGYRLAESAPRPRIDALYDPRVVVGVLQANRVHRLAYLAPAVATAGIHVQQLRSMWSPLSSTNEGGLLTPRSPFRTCTNCVRVVEWGTDSSKAVLLEDSVPRSRG